VDDTAVIVESLDPENSPCGICACDDYGDLCSCEQLCPDCGFEVWYKGPGPMATCNRQKLWVFAAVVALFLTHLLAFYLGDYFAQCD